MVLIEPLPLLPPLPPNSDRIYDHHNEYGHYVQNDHCENRVGQHPAHDQLSLEAEVRRPIEDDEHQNNGQCQALVDE